MDRNRKHGGTGHGQSGICANIRWSLCAGIQHGRAEF